MVTNIVIPAEVATINSYQFANNQSITSIVISPTLTTISNYAFNYCDNLSEIYYYGTEEDFTLTVGSNNANFTNATKYYYSEVEPTEEGNYWHYASDGVTIEIWN